LFATHPNWKIPAYSEFWIRSIVVIYSYSCAINFLNVARYEQVFTDILPLDMEAIKATLEKKEKERLI